jgi:hypothetical protein
MGIDLKAEFLAGAGKIGSMFAVPADRVCDSMCLPGVFACFGIPPTAAAVFAGLPAGV